LEENANGEEKMAQPNHSLNENDDFASIEASNINLEKSVRR
jgi:hypothetical protein